MATSSVTATGFSSSFHGSWGTSMAGEDYGALVFWCASSIPGCRSIWCRGLSFLDFLMSFTEKSKAINEDVKSSGANRVTCSGGFLAWSTSLVKTKHFFSLRAIFSYLIES